MHSPFETSKSVRRSRPSVRSLQTMTRSKQVKDSGKNALTFRPRLLPRARFPSSKKAGKKTFVVFHKHAVPPPFLPSSPSRCALSGSAHLSPVHPGEFCHDRRSAENTHVFLLVVGRAGGRGESAAAMISATAFALPRPVSTMRMEL